MIAITDALTLTGALYFYRINDSYRAIESAEKIKGTSADALMQLASIG